MDIQTRYQEALKFASANHTEKGQKVPGTNLSNDVHICNVAMEILIAAPNSHCFDTAFAVQVALLHHILEDTSIDFWKLEKIFGLAVAAAVFALTKNKELPDNLQMEDSLKRIQELQSEVWAVKLADQITNLQSPPTHWDEEKKIQYRDEAKIILKRLGPANSYLSSRLSLKIKEYEAYIKS